MLISLIFNQIEKLQQLGINFYTFLLESIKFWGLAFRNDQENPGQDSKFFLLLKKLERQGVIFPTLYRYFREETANLSKNQETERNQSFNKIKEVNKSHMSQIIIKSSNFHEKLISFCGFRRNDKNGE